MWQVDRETAVGEGRVERRRGSDQSRLFLGRLPGWTNPESDRFAHPFTGKCLQTIKA